MQHYDKELFNKLFSYNEEAGVIHWKNENFVSRKVRGKVAGTLKNNGYIQIRINNVNYLAHRIIWFIRFEEVPIVIDHINGNRSDNRIINLRNTTNFGNQQNRRSAQSNNLCGLLGVSWCKITKKFVSKINVTFTQLAHYRHIKS